MKNTVANLLENYKDYRF